MSALHLFVPGHPAPQGSKKHVGNGRLVEMSPRLALWRATIVREVAEHYALMGQEPPEWNGAVCLDATFFMPRPKCRPNDFWCAQQPDRDKLLRALCDALESAQVVKNDARFVDGATRKVYEGDGCEPGVKFTVYPL